MKELNNPNCIEQYLDITEFAQTRWETNYKRLSTLPDIV